MYINQDNYEQFFLDHAEGNLSPEMEKDLTDFLEANPDLKPVLEDFDPSPLPSDEIKNDTLRKRLKKNIRPTIHIDQDNIDEWMIRDTENLLGETEADELNEFLSLNPAYSYDQKLFSHTKLVPDLSISYRRKLELKKKENLLPVVRPAWFLYTTAAVILLFIGFRFFRQPEILPSHPVNLPIVELPRLSSPEINADRPFPVFEKKTEKTGTPSRIYLAEITRSNSFRMNPAEERIPILTNISETIAINLAAYHFSPILTTKKREPSLIAKIFTNMITHARDGITEGTNLDEIRKPDFSFWSLAKAGISGYNSISDRELELFVRKNEEGKVKSYALIDNDRLIWSKELNKE